MSNWYFSVNGRAEGPVAEEVIVEGLKSGRFTLVDLVFREGTSGWTTIGEVPHFREAFQALPAPNQQPPETPASNDDFEFTIALKSRPILVETAAESIASVEGRTPVNPTAVSWVVLRKQNGVFVQAGPYSEAQITERIGTGEIEYSMYAWKPGYKRWVRIGNLPEFDRRKRDRENDPVNQIIPLPSAANFQDVLTGASALANVEVQKREDPSAKFRPEPAPQETNGVDLASTLEKPVVKEVSRVFSMPTPMLEPTVAPTIPEASAETPPETTAIRKKSGDEKGSSSKRRRRRAPLYQRAAIALVAALVVAVGLLSAGRWWVGQREDQGRDTKTESADRSADAAPSAAVASTAAAPEPAATDSAPAKVALVAPGARAADASAEPVAKKESSDFGLQAIPPSNRGASVLELIPLKMATSRPLLVFQTDAPVGETIAVKVRAKNGDILEWPTFSRDFQVRRAAGEIASLDLSPLGLPQGTYSAEATVGKVRKQTSFFVGVRDSKFESERQKHIKNMSMQQQAEKKAIFYSAQRLEKLSEVLGESFKRLRASPSKWRAFYLDWKKQAKDAAKPAFQFSHSKTPERLSYPDLLHDFDAATEELAVQARALDAAVTQKRGVATVPLSITKEFKRLRIEASKLSIR